MRCLTPESIPHPGGVQGERLTIPCGKCAICKTNRREEWIVRLLEELKEHTKAVFITLTYDDLKCHAQKICNKNVNKRVVQAFIKALRKLVKQKIRYYAISEYGPRTERPHYHIICYNLSINDYNSINNAWNLGNVVVTELNIRRISYTAKYHVNKTEYPLGREPPFALMSKGIGIGYTKRMSKYHDGDIKKSHYQYYQWKKRLPRYWQNKLYTEEERKQIASIVTSDIYSEEKRNEYEKKYPGHSYFEYIQQKLKENERKFKDKSIQAFNRKI